MQKLLNRNVTPPDGFRYTHETGYVSHAMDHWSWYEDIKKHRKANSLPPISVESAEDQLCAALPPNNCEWDANEQGRHAYVETRLRIRDIAAGATAYVKLMLTGFKTVAQEEANRRAQICSGCYLRVTPQGCGTCAKIGSFIVGDVGKKKTPYDQNLFQKACAACRCPLQPLVHFPLDLLGQNEGEGLQGKLPAFCWRKVGGTNYL